MPDASGAWTVLVADDDPGHLRLMELVLASHRYVVVCVENGDEALEYLERNTPDLMILDVQMPFATGLDVCERARRKQRFRETPVIIMTALTDAATERRANEVGATMVMHKPLTGPTIRGTLRELLEGGGSAQR